MEDIFKKYNINWPVKEFKEYINPKPKSVTSIIEKMQRLYTKKENKQDFTFFNSGINDLLRITIVTEYKDVISIIKKVKELFPDTTGHIKIKNSGYYGVHLHFYLDGIPCEVQLAPELLVMAIDYLHTYYAKWRNFRLEDEEKFLEIKIKEIMKNPNEEERNRLLERCDVEKLALNHLLQEKEDDLKLRQKIYGEVYEITHFKDYKEEIAKVLEYINQTTLERTIIQDERLLEMFHTSLLNHTGLSNAKVRKIAEEILPLLCPMQEKLIHLVKENIIFQKENSAI